MHIFRLKEEIDELNNEKVTDQKFWGVFDALAELESSGFDYNREILKKDNYDILAQKKFLPYQIIPLFLKTKWYEYAKAESQDVI